MARDDVVKIKFGVLGGDSIDAESGRGILEDLERIASKVSEKLKIKINIDTDAFETQLNSLRAKVEEKLGAITVRINPEDARRGDGAPVRITRRSGDDEAKTLDKLYQKKTQLYKLPVDSVAWVKAKEEADELERTHTKQIEQLRVMGEMGRECLANIEAQKQKLNEAYEIEKKAYEINKGKETESRKSGWEGDAGAQAIADTQKTIETLAKKRAQLAKTPVGTKQYVELNKEIEKLNAKLAEQREILGGVVSSTRPEMTGLNKYENDLNKSVGNDAVTNLKKQLDTLYNKKTQLLTAGGNKVKEEELKNQTAELTHEIAQQQTKLSEKHIISEAQARELEEYKRKLEEVYLEQEKLVKQKPASEIDKVKIKDKAESLFSTNGFDKTIQRSREARALAEGYKSKVDTMFKSGGTITKKDIQNLNAEFIQTETKLREIGRATDTVGNKLMDAFGERAIQAAASALVAFAGRGLKQVYTNVVNLDSALTDLQIATGKTRDETKELLITYSNLGKQMGATTKEVSEAADAWLRQGYNVAETNQLIVNSMMLSKLGQIDSAEATKALTSAMKGYKVEVQDSLGIVDKLTAVDMEAAVSAGDIATAMSETATGADIAGVSMDTLIGYIATVAEVTQDGAESVGTFYKTLFSRMGNVKAGVFVDDETGESLNDVEKVLGQVGISLRDSRNEFRSFDKVLGDVANQWNNYTTVQKHALATAFAGTRQQEKFTVLMENYGDALKYADTAASSGGTASTKYEEAYLDSIEAKMNTLSASWEEFSSLVLDSEIIKTGVGFLSGIVNLLNNILRIGDGMLVLIPAITATLLALWAIILRLRATMFFTTVWTGIKQILSILPILGTVLKALILQIQAKAVAHTHSASALALETEATIALDAARKSLSSINPATWVLLAVVAVVGLIKAIVELSRADEKAREAAIGNAKSLQEEADALKEVSDAAKEAKDSIDELVEEIKNLDDSIDNADWYHYLEELGTSIGDLYGDEGLSSLQAINKLLETAYSYSELIQMSDERRLEILNEIAKKSAEELKNQQRKTYESQKTASVEMIKAQGQKMKVNTKGDVGRDAVAEFLDEMGGKELGFYKGSNSTILKGELKAGTAKEFVEKVQSVIDNYEEKYQYNLSSLSDNDVYNRFSEMLEAGKEALKNQTEAALDYLNAVSQTAGLTVDVDLKTKDVDAEYKRVRNDIIEEIEKDETISTAIKQGVLDSNQIAEYAESFIADHYKSLYNNIQKTVVSARGMVNMLGDVENQYDTLTDALDEMSESGVLSADTIKAMKNEYPELEEYLEKTAEGYKLSDGALSNYMGKVSKSYMDDITSAQKYFNSVYEAYENLPDSEKTIEEYEKVIEAQNSLNNAIENAEDWRRTEMTLGREKLIEQYTDLLEKQSDALDEQCDKYKDLCDIRKDLLETYQEEVNAKRELESKQRNVVDLQTQLALARMDSSASGQAKVRDLESELEEAQDELEEYTLEQAIEAICTDIDDTSSEYENLINQEIKSIEEGIDGISKLLSEDIVTAIKESGENPVVGDEGDGEDSISSNSKTYQDTVQGAKEAMKNLTIGQAQSVSTTNQKSAPTYKTSGKLTSGVSLGDGLSGLSKTNPRENDDVDVIIGGKLFDLLAGKVIGNGVARELKEINGGNGKAGDVVAYDGKLYIFDHGGNWRQMADDHDRVSEAATAYLALLNKNTYHTGGLVGSKTALESNEVFAKLMKGEFVSTPTQMDRFIKETLPSIANRTNSAGGDAIIHYNSPLIEIQCGSVTDDTLPKLRDLVNEAVTKIEKDMTAALSRTGYRKKY